MFLSTRENLSWGLYLRSVTCLSPWRQGSLLNREDDGKMSPKSQCAIRLLKLDEVGSVTSPFRLSLIDGLCQAGDVHGFKPEVGLAILQKHTRSK